RGVAESPRPGQRPRPRDAARDVLRPEPPVERERAGEALGRGVGALREPAAPGLRHGSSAAMSAMMRAVTSRRVSRAPAPFGEKPRGGPKRTATGVAPAA